VNRIRLKPGEFDAYHNVKRDYGEPMIQEHISKQGYCTACLLLDRDSREIASFTYERVKEYPMSGGPTVVWNKLLRPCHKGIFIEAAKERGMDRCGRGGVHH
jgi:hypothetical protein